MTINESEWRLIVRRGAVLVACNLGDGTAAIDVDDPHRMVLASHPDVCCQSGVIQLPAESIAVLERLHGDDS